MDGNVEQRFRVLVYERRKTNGLLGTLQDEFGDAVAAVDVVQGYDLCFAAPNAGAAVLAAPAAPAANAWVAPFARAQNCNKFRTLRRGAFLPKYSKKQTARPYKIIGPCCSRDWFVSMKRLLHAGENSERHWEVSSQTLGKKQLANA